MSRMVVTFYLHALTFKVAGTLQKLTYNSVIKTAF